MNFSVHNMNSYFFVILAISHTQLQKLRNNLCVAIKSGFLYSRMCSSQLFSSLPLIVHEQTKYDLNFIKNI